MERGRAGREYLNADAFCVTNLVWPYHRVHAVAGGVDRSSPVLHGLVVKPVAQPDVASRKGAVRAHVDMIAADQIVHQAGQHERAGNAAVASGHDRCPFDGSIRHPIALLVNAPVGSGRGDARDECRDDDDSSHFSLPDPR